MYKISEFSKIFSFLLNVLSMFVGVIISRYYQGGSIFPISKTLSVSFGVTILYFLVKFVWRLNIEPYGDIVICASVGLIAESIFAIIFSNKDKIAKGVIDLAMQRKIDIEKSTKDTKEKEKENENNDEDFLSKF